MGRVEVIVILSILGACTPCNAAPAGIEERLRQIDEDPALASPEELNELVDTCRELGDRSCEGRALCRLAQLDLTTGNQEAARKNLERIETIPGFETIPQVAGCHAYVEGLSLFIQGKQAEARELWDAFADSEMAGQAPREQLWSLIGGMIASFSKISDLDGAVSRGRRARELADRLPGLADKARTYTNLATALSIKGDYREAGEVAAIGLDLGRKAGWQAAEAICLTQMGNAAHQAGDRERALRLCSESLELVTRDADRFYALICICTVLQSEGRLEEALERTGEALLLADRLGDARMRAHARNILGMTHLEIGDPGRAEALAEESLDLLGPEGSALDRAWALKTRGTARSVLQRHTLSIDDLRESFELFGSLENLTAQARVAIDLGNVQYYLNRIDRALDYYEQAVELAERVGAIEVRHNALSNLALCKRRFGRLSESRRILLDQAEEIDSTDAGALSANTLLNLAEALDGIGETAAAGPLASRALETTAVNDSAMLLARTMRVMAGVRSAEGRHDEAISRCRTALGLCESLGPWTSMDVHWKCGNVFLDGGLEAEGEESLRTALRIGEEARTALQQPAFRASFLSNRTGLYVDLVSAVLKRGVPDHPPGTVEEALEISERFRAWTLLDALAGKPGQEPAEPDRRSGLLARMAAIHLEMIGATDERHAELLDEIRRTEDRLAAITRSAGHAVLGGARTSASDIRAAVPDGETAFLEYLTGIRSSYVFVVTRDRVRVAGLPANRDEIREDVHLFRGLIRRRGDDQERDRLAIRTLGEKLYRTLIAPVEGFANGSIRRLVICPDGALHSLPFETLVVPGEDPDGPVHYLVENFGVAVVPSLGVLTQLRREKPAAREAPVLAAFANPQHQSDRYPPLPYSEEEVRIAARRLGGDSLIHAGSEANEATARLALTGGHRVVHFAAHGFLDPGSIGRSGLVLTPDPDAGDDGLLQAREVVDLDVDADLVVLSGCSTGGGRLLPGEGPMGLPHAFLQAGAPSILMSLWDVRDRGAAVFMDRFYTGLASDLPVGEALREAKLDLISSDRAELRHPSVWGPFVIAGLSDRRLDLPARESTRPTVPTGWIVGLLLLGTVLWSLGVIARRRSRSAPARKSR